MEPRLLLLMLSYAWTMLVIQTQKIPPSQSDGFASISFFMDIFIGKTTLKASKKSITSSLIEDTFFHSKKQSYFNNHFVNYPCVYI